MPPPVVNPALLVSHVRPGRDRVRPALAAVISLVLHAVLLFACDGGRAPLSTPPSGPLQVRLTPVSPPLAPSVPPGAPDAHRPLPLAASPPPAAAEMPVQVTQAPAPGARVAWTFEPDPDPRFPYVQVRVLAPDLEQTDPPGQEPEGEFHPATALDALPAPLLRFPVPDPRVALQLPVRARWRLAVWLDEAGLPLAVRTLAGEGPPPLLEVAQEALAQTAFRVPAVGGQPVRTRVDLVVEFGYDT